MPKCDKSWVDRNPTLIKYEDGKTRNPDREQRFSIKYEDGKRIYQCDDKPVGLNDFVGGSSGKQTLSSNVGTFAGIGEGTMRKSYESDDDFNKRMRK